MDDPTRREEHKHMLGDEIAPQPKRNQPMRPWIFWGCVLLGLRALSGLMGALLAVFNPFTPSDPEFAALLERAGQDNPLLELLFVPWLRWDVPYYYQLVEQGYRPDALENQFHPLYPWLARPVSLLLGNQPLIALLVISSLATLAFLVYTERLAMLDLDRSQAHQATLLVALLPPAFILMTPYTEALFLLLTTLTLLWARQERWWLAGSAGFLAALTRQQGVVLCLPLLWELAQAKGWRHSFKGLSWLAVGLPPLGLACFILFRILVVNEVSFDWQQPDSFIYSLIISNQAKQIITEQAFLLPPHALWLALQAPLTRQLLIDLGLGLALLALLALSWPHMRASYRVYSLAIMLLAFAYYTGPRYPYMGLPRHALLVLPVLTTSGHWLSRLKQGYRLPLVAVLLTGYLVLLTLYFQHGWIP